MSESTAVCPACQNAIPSRAMGGLCPFCLAASVAADLEGRAPAKPGRSAPEPLEVPERVGPYRLFERLGEGGHGVVYRAGQEEPLRRTVALKVMKAGAMSAQAGARFEAERQALAMMDHPAIAHVYDVGETAEGLPYFVMELIEGVPITTFCAENGLSRDERVRLFRQVCEAIAHAHRRGIIHRDLKPSNILVTACDGEAHPKVIDFGIAKATETLLTERTLVTRDHQLVGTPAYMSPEQAAMRGGEIDTRADIYSLGVVLYELLTGTTPFRIEELAGLPYDEALRKVRTGDPQRPSSRCRELTRTGDGEAMVPGELRLAVSTDLDWIVLKALAKEPERRYETAAALSRDLGRFLAGEAIEARPPTAGYVLGTIVRRHRIPVLAAAAVILALVAGAVVSLGMYLRAEHEATRATRNEERAAAQAQLAQESDERARRLFSSADFTLAAPFLDDGRPGLAVAHLARAVRSNPANHAASARLLYTLASENWARPSLSVELRFGPVFFTPDGTEFVAIGQSGRDGERRTGLLVFDAHSGAKPWALPLEALPVTIDLSPSGRLVAIGYAHGAVEVRELPRGGVRWSSPPPERGDTARVRFSPEGERLLAFCSNDNRLRVWESEGGKLVREIAVGGKGGPVDGLEAAFSPSGDRVVCASGRDVRVIDLGTGQQVGEAMTHRRQVVGVAFLPDGARVASWSRDASARVWEVETSRVLLTLTHEQPVATAAVSPDGSRLLTGTGAPGGQRWPGSSRLWDLDTGELIGQPVEHPSEVACVAFSPDGSKAATGSLVHRHGDGALRVFDAWTGEPLMAPIFHPRGASSLAFSPDGTRIAVSSRHRETAVWDLRPGVFEPIHVRTGSAVWRAVFDRDDRSVLTVEMGGLVRRWDAATGEALSGPAETGPAAIAAWGGRRDSLRDGVQVRRRHDAADLPALLPERFREGTPRSAAASEDGERLITGGADGMVRVWSLRDGDLLVGPLGHRPPVPVNAVAVHADGRRLASGGADGSVILWNLADGQQIASQQMHEAVVNQLAFAPDGRSLASASQDGTARLWWFDRHPALSAPLDNREWVNYVSFNPDGRTLASAGRDNAARLWDAATGEPRSAPLRHIDTATYGLFLLWLPDSRRLVTTASHDNTARLWDAQSGQLLAKPMEQPTGALSAALRPDGEALLFGDDHDFQARVWDLASGEPLTPLLMHDERVLSAAFDSTGGRLLTGTRNGSAWLWDVPAPSRPLPEGFLAFAEALGGFRFNPAGVLEQVPAHELARAREVVARGAATEGGAPGEWMRWLALDLEHRTTSPHSELPLQVHVEELVRRDRPESLRQALLLDPANPIVMGRLGYRLVAQSEPTLREVRYGGFLVRRAVELAPDNADLKWMRALVVLQERIRRVGAAAP